MKVLRRWGATALLGVSLMTGAGAAATTSVEMLRELFRTPVTEWSAQLKTNNRLLNEEFFSNVEKRMRWGIENNHVDDAFRFAMVGDFSAEVTGRPANFRIDLAELFFKAENYLLAGQVVDNIIISSPGTVPAKRAQFLRGRLKELQKDLYGAYQDFFALAEMKYLPDQTWYKCGMISSFLGEEERAKKEFTVAAAAGSEEAREMLRRIEQEGGNDFNKIEAIPNSIDPRANQQKPNVTPDSPGMPDMTPDVTPEVRPNVPSTAPVEPAVTPTSPPVDAMQSAKLRAADNKLPEAIELYRSIVASEPGNLEAIKGMGALLYRTGDLAQAKQAFDQGLKGSPQDVELLRFRANTLERLFDREGQKADLVAAIADYKLASSLAPNDPFLDWELARAQAKNRP